MARRRRDGVGRRFGGVPFIAEFLRVLGYVDLALAPVGVLVVLAVRVRLERPIDAVFVIMLVGGFVVGVTLGGLLLGLGTAVRYADVVAEARRAREEDGPDMDRAVPAWPGEGASAAHPGGGARHDGLGQVSAGRILAVLEEIRDLALTAPEGRDPARARMRANNQRRAAEAIVDAVNARRLGEARALLTDAEARFGGTSTLERLRDRIEQDASRNEPFDYARTKRLVEQAAAEGRWGRGERWVRRLCYDHPDSARCRQLWDDTRRAGLHAHVQQCVRRRHWAEALTGAEEFLGRFPDSPEAKDLRAQIDTLRANADISARKQYETKFKALIGVEKYAEAHRLARYVIERFPESPQAGALRAQLPAIERRVTAAGA